MVEDLRELFAYNRWANGRILDAGAKLDDEAWTRALISSFPSVRETLAHVLASEWVWLERWHGRSPSGPPESWDTRTPASLRAIWAGVEREGEAFLAGLTDADAARTFSYRNIRGEPFTSTFAETMRHVVNHSTYHRGQVVTLLRQLGAEGVNTDLIAFYRLQAAGQVPVSS